MEQVVGDPEQPNKRPSFSAVQSRESRLDVVQITGPGAPGPTYINDSGWESGSGAAGIALDVILTAGISSAIDSATGADNKYESPVNISMVPLMAAQQAKSGGSLPGGPWLERAHVGR